MATARNPEIPNPDEELVKVFDSEQESEVMVVRSLLESAGIDTATTNLDAPQDILPGVGGIILQVRADQADEARQVIEEYLAAGAAAAEEAERQTEADTAEDKQG
jgi:hypothetical protein